MRVGSVPAWEARPVQVAEGVYASKGWYERG